MKPGHQHEEYKETNVPWIGKIPIHWDMVRIGAVLQERGETNEDGTVNDVLSLVRQRGVIPYEEKGNIGNKMSEDITRYKIVRPNDIVVNSMNVIIGSVGLSEYTGCLSPVYYVLRKRSPTDDSKYIAAYFQSLPFQRSLTRLGNGILAHRMRIPMDLLKSEPFPKPPPEEQDAIVRFLDHADEQIQHYIACKERLIALLEEERQALVHQAVTRGLDPSVRLKDSGVEWLGDMPEHWEIRRAKYLYREADEHSETGTEQLMSVSHKTGVTPRKENVTMFLAESNIGHKLCRPGDIVINTMWAFMAALGVARQEGLVSPSYGVYRPHGESHLDHDYMDSLIRTEAYRMNYLVRSTGITSSRLRLYPESFLGIPLVYPPKVEQDAIAEHIDEVTTSVDDAITRTRSQIDLMNEYRTRLIADVVTGQLDVREAAAQLPAAP